MGNVIIRALETELKRLERKKKEIEDIVFANPVSEIFKIRKKADKILSKSIIKDTVDMAALDKLAQEERHWREVAKKQEKTVDLLNKLSEIEDEIYQLRNEIGRLKAWEKKK